MESVGIVIEDVSLAFGSTEVLKGVNLDIAPGEFFAFLGPSGSGKSTLLRAIAGFGPQPRGRILIGGKDVAGLPPWHRDVGMVFQSYALWPHMTVAQNVAFGLEERRVARPEIKERVAEALTLVGLEEYAGRRPSQLSGGQQQRVALARTIVVRPRVLLLDEPLSNLDANLRVQMRRELLALQRKLELTTIFVTHDQEEANTTSDRMAVLDDGIIQQVGPPMSLYDQPVNPFVAGFLGTANILRGTIEESNGKTAFVSGDGTRVALGKTRSGPASIVFRPQNVSLAARQTETGEDNVTLHGAIKNREFLGNIIRYDITVGKHSIIVDQNHHRDEAQFGPNDNVALIVAPEHIVVLAD